MADGEDRVALSMIAKLFTLDYIRRHAGTYLAAGHITSGAFSGLDDEYSDICARLIEHLPLLVDSFGIDEDILAAPVTSNDRIAAWEQRSHERAHLWS
ncbi:acyl-CoA dehydrogenase [Lentzea sp. NPDC059081]|uniref:acyl-CoA dehydrogenase n=1 Tax=Lentzea sp. NPDC059081 TaxID=3346719 RepID=UPI0036AB41CB